MSFLLVAALLVLGIGTGMQKSIAPETLNDINLGAELPSCEEEAANPQSVNEEKGRAANFSLRGRYICQRRLFEYGERASFSDFVVRHQSDFAKRVALNVRSALERDEVTKQPFAVLVEAEDFNLQKALESTLTTELVPLLSEQQMVRLKTDISKLNVLRVKVNNVDDPQYLFTSWLEFTDKAGERQWLRL